MERPYERSHLTIGGTFRMVWHCLTSAMRHCEYFMERPYERLHLTMEFFTQIGPQFSAQSLDITSDCNLWTAIFCAINELALPYERNARLWIPHGATLRAIALDHGLFFTQFKRQGSCANFGKIGQQDSCAISVDCCKFGR